MPRGAANCGRRWTSFRTLNTWMTRSGRSFRSASFIARVIWIPRRPTRLSRNSYLPAANAHISREFSQRIFYCEGDMDTAAAYEALKKQLASGSEPLRRNLLFYLATSPSQFGQVVEQVHRAGLLHKDDPEGWQRVVIEKHFGHDLDSARQLNRELTRFVRAQQVFRIDHYLGKETVQNILMFRFSNAVFERLWHRESIDHFQITVSEKLGVGQRGGYYEEAGALRDMVQNHMLQVLSLVAMEPPVSLEAESI